MVRIEVSLCVVRLEVTLCVVRPEVTLSVVRLEAVSYTHLTLPTKTLV